MKSHAEDLKNEYKEDACRVLEDRAHNPNHYWVYRLHSSFRAKYGDGYRPKMLKKLEDSVRNCKYAKLKIIDEESNYVVSIVSKFMVQVHQQIAECSEVLWPMSPLNSFILYSNI